SALIQDQPQSFTSTGPAAHEEPRSSNNKHFRKCCHSFIHCLPLIRTTLGSRGACAYLRRHRASRQDTPWTECQPIAGHTHTHSLTQSHTTDNLEMPINLPCMSLDWGRKPEYPEETPEARGEHANSTHTAEAGIEPPTLEV
ncbi:hypothetical protein QTP86_033120, partial [Hemibagrus guttatus]